MHKLLTGTLLLFAALATLTTRAQVVTGRNTSTYHGNLDTSRPTDIRERLVQLALQNPNYEIADRRVLVADYELARAKGGWLSILSASGNLNELSIKQGSGSGAGSTANNLFFPRYNFAVTLPLDFFITRANDVKVARQNVYIAEAEKNEAYRKLRRDVLSKYEDYLMHKDILELQTRIASGEYTDYKLAETDFRDGTITAEAFKTAETNYYTQEMKKVELQRNYNVSKYELELMIGVPIDDVLPKK
ncbi:MAG: TolC family protein [Candidatus Pseudobacter hemicellulosilyticus]|uniref:TolC family protein n=1 Tax=Candidatus Pseudobacter hemicellulosilyticus TaxID=3121375 RepID=A0AAJ6BG08_9BACT|nr:MAG: TolC family protein [Pseudobacter sp.]